MICVSLKSLSLKTTAVRPLLSIAIDSNGLTAVVFNDRDFNETQITELLYELDIRLESESGGATPVGSNLISVGGHAVKGPLQGADVFANTSAPCSGPFTA